MKPDRLMTTQSPTPLVTVLQTPQPLPLQMAELMELALLQIRVLHQQLETELLVMPLVLLLLMTLLPPQMPLPQRKEEDNSGFIKVLSCNNILSDFEIKESAPTYLCSNISLALGSTSKQLYESQKNLIRRFTIYFFSSLC